MRQIKNPPAIVNISILLILIACAGSQAVKPVQEPAIAPRDWGNFQWEREYFSDRREPLYPADYRSTGYSAVQYIRFISDNLFGRKPFSYREKEAAAWLVDEILAIGHPWENIQVQEFPVDTGDHWWALNNDPKWISEFSLRQTEQLSQNIILTVKGQSELIMIAGAHYDSYPTPGASDNASGVSLLLESAQRILSMDNYYTIMYVFFGAEEVGLVGSSYFIGNLEKEKAENIVLMINADDLFEGHYLFYGAATEKDGRPDENAITHQIDAIARELDMGLIARPDSAFLLSDQLPFLMRGHTVVALEGLFRTEYLRVPGFFMMDDYMFMRTVGHTQADCFHQIEASWPGLIETNMRAFSIFLERLLLMN